MDRFFKICYD